MKVLSSLIILITFISCGDHSENSASQPSLEGFWMLGASEYAGGNTSNQMGCPVPDVPIEMLYSPNALGAQIWVQKDSISLFRYPYEYYGTFGYQIIDDSLIITPDHSTASQIHLEQTSSKSFTLNFEEAFSSTCILSAKAEYLPFTPNQEVIDQLIQDSISCDSLVGKWWYLRKYIAVEDGSEPMFLAYPDGVPDSILITKEMIHEDSGKPFVEFNLKGQNIKMFFIYPSDNQFFLEPKWQREKDMLECTITYEELEDVDTFYVDLEYNSY